MIALHQNVANCQNTLTVLPQRWKIFLQDIWMGQMRMTDAGTTQDNFILLAPPVGGLPISQDWLDRMKLVQDRTVPIILPSGKDILVDTMFKIIIGYTTILSYALWTLLRVRFDIFHGWHYVKLKYTITTTNVLWHMNEGNVLFNDALNTFYLRLYGIGHMVKDHSDSERRNPLPPHGLLFPISSKGSFICIIPQTGLCYSSRGALAGTRVLWHRHLITLYSFT